MKLSVLEHAKGFEHGPEVDAIGGYGGAGGAAGSGAGGAGTHGLVLRGKCSRMHVKRVHRQTSRDPQLHRLEARGKRHRRNHRVLSLRWRQKTRGGAFSQCCAFGNLCSGRGGDRYRSCCRCQESFRGSSRSCRGQHCKGIERSCRRLLIERIVCCAWARSFCCRKWRRLSGCGKKVGRGFWCCWGLGKVCGRDLCRGCWQR
mmetsp:Transcript_5692/g.13466  ORF Transcript_5692/g.13466 Transcript_5692/m.13466 type:complete len:202 (-) Transcript_5692:180-785(-)